MPNVPGKMVSTATHGQVADAKQIWDEYYEGGKFQSAINSALKTASAEASTAANNAKTTAEGVSTRVATLEAVVAQINGTNSGSGQGNSGGSISALETRVSTLETNYNEHDGAINDHELNIENLQYEVFGSEYVQGGSPVERPGLINDVAALKREIGISSGGSTMSLSARVGSLETSVASHTTSITNINGTLTEQASALSELASYKDDAITAKDAAKSSEDAAKTYAEKCEYEVVKNASSSGASAASAKIDDALGNGGVIKEALDNATDNLIYISGIKDIPQFQSGAKYIANDLVFNTVNGEKAIYRVVESTNNAVWSSDESKYKKTNIVRELNDIRGTREERLTVYVTNTGIDYSKLSLVVAYEGNVGFYTFDTDGSSQAVIPSGIKYTMQVQVAEGGTTNLRNSPVYTYIAYSNTRDVNVTLASNQANAETITVNLSLSSPSGVLRATYLDLHITVTDLTDGNKSEQYSLEKNGSSNANGTVTFSVPLGHTYTISYSMDNVTSEEDGQTVTYSYSLPRTTQLVARVYQRTISYTVPQIENELFECAYEYSVGDKKYLGLCDADVLESDNAENPDAITYDMVRFIHVNPKSLTDVKSSAAPTGDASFWLYVGEWRYTDVPVVANGKASYYDEAISGLGMPATSVNGKTYISKVAALKSSTGNAGNDGFLTTQKADINANGDYTRMPSFEFIRNYDLSYGNTSYNKTFFLSAYQMYVFKTLMLSGKELYTFLQKLGRLNGYNGAHEVVTPVSSSPGGRSYRVGHDSYEWEYASNSSWPTCANYYNFKILSV